MNWYISVLKNYIEFSGRAHRTEYWMFFLFHMIVTFVIAFVEGMVGSPGFLSMIYALAVMLPSIGVGVRRLHDTGRTGWWLLIAFLPVIGAIVLLVFLVLDTEAGDNQYGSDPKAGGDAETA